MNLAKHTSSEYSEAAKFLERNIGLKGKLRADPSETSLIVSAASESLSGASTSAARGSSLTGHQISPHRSATPMPLQAGLRKRWHWSQAPSGRTALVRVTCRLLPFCFPPGGSFS